MPSTGYGHSQRMNQSVEGFLCSERYGTYSDRLATGHLMTGGTESGLPDGYEISERELESGYVKIKALFVEELEQPGCQNNTVFRPVNSLIPDVEHIITQKI